MYGIVQQLYLNYLNQQSTMCTYSMICIYVTSHYDSILHKTVFTPAVPPGPSNTCDPVLQEADIEIVVRQLRKSKISRDFETNEICMLVTDLLKHNSKGT